MGKPISVIGNMHTCPMTEGWKVHVGGPISGPGVPGVFIDGKPVAVVGDNCICTGGSAPDKIITGCPGVLVDGKPVAWLGSQTAHGGIVTEGIPGVTISGGFPEKADNPEKLEPRIFNLKWKKEEVIINRGDPKETFILSADTVGYEDGESITLTIFKEGEEEVMAEVTGTVKNGRLEAEWSPERIEKEK